MLEDEPGGRVQVGVDVQDGDRLAGRVRRQAGLEEAGVDAQPRLAYKVMRALFRVTHTNLMRMNQESQQLANYIHKSQGRY